jgi:hypothetical protein
MEVSEQKEKCARPGCNCDASIGDCCSEQCRNPSPGQTDCNCGHQDCRSSAAHSSARGPD